MTQNESGQTHKLARKTVLVTGSSRGIGAAIAQRLATDGYDLVVHYRSETEKAEAVARQVEGYGSSVRLLSFDISDRDACRQILEEDIATHGCYYGVVCNAGINHDTAFPAMTGEQWDNTVHTNLDAFYNVLHPLVMPLVRTRKPARIVTLSSVSGIIGNRGQTNYSASKAGIIGATKSLALELAKRQITVNCVAPGLIDTDMSEGAPVDKIKEMIPLRRLGQASEVAAVVSFLLSEGAAYVTRQVISVDGGLS